MPRSLRSDFAGQIYHALNRGNARNKIFFKDADFEAFERVVQLGLEKYPVDLILWNWCGGDSVIQLSAWPVKRLPRWIERVNEPITKKEKTSLQKCIQRGCPFGTKDWGATTAKEQGLEITLRPRGRPRKLA